MEDTTYLTLVRGCVERNVPALFFILDERAPDSDAFIQYPYEGMTVAVVHPNRMLEFLGQCNQDCLMAVDLWFFLGQEIRLEDLIG